MEGGDKRVGQTPVSVKVVYRRLGDNTEEEIGQEGEEEEGEGDPQAAVKYTEELCLR